MASYGTQPVRVRGLRELQRGFRRMSAAEGGEIRKRLLEIAGTATERAKSNLEGRSKKPRGRIARTGKAYARQKGAGVRFTHPGAGVQEWGGTISPRGTPIEIRGKHFAVDAVDAEREAAVLSLEEMIDDLALGVGGFD